MPVAPPTDPSLRPRARRPRSACHPRVRSTAESRRPADQEFLRRNSSLRPTADSQRWRPATDHWQLLAGAHPPGRRPAHRPLARRPQVAWAAPLRQPAGAARADPRSQLRTTPTNSGPPRRPAPATRVRASSHNPAQSRPHAVPIRPADDQYCKTYRTHYSYEQRATRKSGVLRRCSSLHHPAAASPRQPTAGARRLPAGPSPCGRTPRPTVPSRLRHSHAPARRHCFSRPSISAAHDPAELWPTRGATRPHPGSTPHTTARPNAPRTPSRPYPQMIRPADAVVLTTRTKFEPRADQALLRRNSSLRQLAISQRWRPATRRLATACSRLPARPTPSAPPPRPKPPARVSPGSPPPSRPNMAPAFPVRDSRCSTRRTHYSHEARAHASRNLPRNSSAHRQPADSPPRQPAPGDGQLPTGPTLPTPSAPHPAPDGPKWPGPRHCAGPSALLRADPRSQVRATPMNTGRPAAPRARTPAPRLTPQPAPTPSQSVPIRPPDDQYCKTYRTHYSYEQLATRKLGVLRRCSSLHHPAAASPRQPTAGARRLPAGPSPCGRTPRPTVPSRLRHSHAPARRHCFSRPSIPAAHDPDEHWSARGAPRPHPRTTPHPTARPKAARSPSRPYPQNDQAC